MDRKTLFDAWCRRPHYFLGLFLLFFVWLFALTGLLLNHEGWRFAEFWPQRHVTSTEHPIAVPLATAPLEQARDLMRQLDLAGEIQWPAGKTPPDKLEFRLTRPGQHYEVKADWTQARATVQRTALNAWGTARLLHTFTGVRSNDPRNERDWMLTTIWAWSMDAVAFGLIMLVVTGIILWWRRATRIAWGLVALVGGTLACGWFVWALRWLAA